MPHGLGKMYKPDGSLFVGRFTKGKAEGQGLYILANGDYFQGILTDNKADCTNGKFVSSEYNY